MYNHYIPQSDGSFRRSSVPEPNRRSGPRPQQQHPNPSAQASKPEPQPCPPPPQPQPEPRREQTRSCQEHPGIFSFLRRLLPKDTDSTDLIVIVLLLLLCSEEEEGDLAPLLTIALYFLL